MSDLLCRSRGQVRPPRPCLSAAMCASAGWCLTWLAIWRPTIRHLSAPGNSSSGRFESACQAARSVGTAWAWHYACPVFPDHRRRVHGRPTMDARTEPAEEAVSDVAA